MRGRPGRPHGSGLDGYMSEVWTATGVRPRSRRRKGGRDVRPPVRWRRRTADGYGFAAQGPGRSSGRAVPVTVRPHGIRQRRCGSAGRRVAGTTTTERRRPCCARSGSCGSTGQCASRAHRTEDPHGRPVRGGSVRLRWAWVGRDAGTSQDRSVLLASVAGFSVPAGPGGNFFGYCRLGVQAGPPNARAHDQPAAVFGQKQHERPGPIGSPDLPQANRLLMLAEQLHCVCQVRGLDAPEARVPQPKSIDRASGSAGVVPSQTTWKPPQRSAARAAKDASSLPTSSRSSSSRSIPPPPKGSSSGYSHHSTRPHPWRPLRAEVRPA